MQLLSAVYVDVVIYSFILRLLRQRQHKNHTNH